MKPEELVEACRRCTQNGLEKVTLMVPREPTGERITLLGRGTPLGDILCWNARLGVTVALFDIMDVLAWLCSIGQCSFGVALAIANDADRRTTDASSEGDCARADN